MIFQSTQPEWAATSLCRAKLQLCCDFNPRSPSGLRRNNYFLHPSSHLISIHAARVGCDVTVNYIYGFIVISIHAARVGCDKVMSNAFVDKSYFNPRSPSGLRQRSALWLCISIQNFNPRSPSGLRPAYLFLTSYKVRDFNPRSPSGLRLFFSAFTTSSYSISIHAARVGCDCGVHLVRSFCRLISIHAARVGCDCCQLSA